MRGPHRIQRRRAKGWRMPAGAVYVGRGSKWGNPFRVGVDGTREQCCDYYRALAGGLVHLGGRHGATLEAQEAAHGAIAEARHELAGKDLASWCLAGALCHADVLIAIANGTRLRGARRLTFTRIE